MVLTWFFFLLLWMFSNAANLRLLECNPPDMPIWGGYGPVEEYYSPGDTIHYFCAVDTFIGGNYFRKCLDTGDWSGDTPVCDAPSSFSSTSQSSTGDDESSGSELAVDEVIDTCTSTARGERGEWSGTFSSPGQLIRVMLFLPTGFASYQVILVKENGAEVSCGSQTRSIDSYDWTFHNCPEPNNTAASGLKIRSLSNEPLQICEIRAFVLTSPKCTDPRTRIENGHLRVNRKSAVLVCNRGFLRSPDTKLECIREGQWSRKNLFCSEPSIVQSIGEQPTGSLREPLSSANQGRERESVGGRRAGRPRNQGKLGGRRRPSQHNNI